MRRLYIMEKPSLAAAVAGYLWPRDFKKLKNEFCYSGKVDGVDTVITWTIGHAMYQLMPGDYKEEWKQFSVYPVIPETWKKAPSPDKKKQMKFIKDELKKADEVVNGGDPDREGQLLVDEVLEYYNYKGPVKRILVNAYDDESLRRAFASIRENSDFRNLYYAGLARERADWLYGMNCSRAYTINGRKFGVEATMRIGRVKVPTLALVVRREREIQGFKPKDYFILEGIFDKGGKKFKGTYVPEEDMMDSEGRVVKKSLLENLVKGLSGQGQVTLVEKKSGKEAPPLPYSLDTLQVDANKRYKLSPKQVLDTVQSLYEKKYVTYPRSDCNYIPVAQQEDGERILRMLSKIDARGASGADPSLKSKAFNDKKVSAHHAIIPTTVSPSGLSEIEDKVYDLIAERYILQFYPPCEFDVTSFEVTVGDAKFKGSGKVVRSRGFKSVYSGDGKEEQDVVLPAIVKGDIVGAAYNIVSRTTTPPKRFTEGSLIAAMTNIWRFVNDKETKEMLKECKGLGTPATRDTIIAELMEKKNGMQPCMKKVKNELVPTDFGMALVDNVDEHLTNPDFTAMMEYNLGEIANGKMELDTYLDEIITDVMECIHHSELPESYKTFHKEGVSEVLCPVCKKTNLQKRKVKSTGKTVWICPDDACVNKDGKKVFYEDNNGEPLILGNYECKVCGKPLKRVFIKSSERHAWVCEGCSKWYDDKDAKPVFLEDFKCPSCQNSLKRVYIKKHDKYSWVCDKCNKWFDDNDGKAVFPKEIKCPECGNPVKHIHKKDGTTAFLCESCNKWFDDDNGKPVKQKGTGRKKPQN